MIDSILDKVDKMTDGNGKNYGCKARSTFAGILIGGITGIMIGFTKGKNIFLGALSGAFIGGLAGHITVPKK